MTVIINSFEIEPATPPDNRSAEDTAADPGDVAQQNASVPLRPIDIQDVLRRDLQRKLRLRAH